MPRESVATAFERLELLATQAPTPDTGGTFDYGKWIKQLQSANALYLRAKREAKRSAGAKARDACGSS